MTTYWAYIIGIYVTYYICSQLRCDTTSQLRATGALIMQLAYHSNHRWHVNLDACRAHFNIFIPTVGGANAPPAPTVRSPQALLPARWTPYARRFPRCLARETSRVRSSGLVRIPGGMRTGLYVHLFHSILYSYFYSRVSEVLWPNASPEERNKQDRSTIHFMRLLQHFILLNSVQILKRFKI